MEIKIEICKICNSKFISKSELITDFIYGDKTKKIFLNVSHVMSFIKSRFLKKEEQNFINKNLKNLCPQELEKILDG